MSATNLIAATALALSSYLSQDSGSADVNCAPYNDCRTAYDHADTRYRTVSEELEVLQRQHNEALAELKRYREREKRQQAQANVSRGERKVKDKNVVQSPPSNNNSNNASGTVVGTYVGSFNTSYYGMDCVGCTGRTASGYNTAGRTTYNGMTVLAADTSVLPLRTKVRVVNPDGSSYVGIVLDRGGAIKGRKLDVLVSSEAESARHGRHQTQVYVIEYGDNKYIKEG